ncbi:uncharacterized protein TRAVEDRAFT_50895 [Trametes versicolor FP-101664 SS1]|uniref:uncharacterized protein n=1 Tax=Trametes versicolor (strain FP-101664) TaxID=717944 RepID=UPI0004624863|nr:uncharacterized protein TRAVEDRAFT_50895 [Trametes versicolor FP-101664 SS1]EIW54757.1 hypothetical protein TRAVEDRAFT_50895 [Trametes versicolor FP-101664 SS1]
MKFDVPILRHIFSFADMETLTLTCRPASLMCLTITQEEVVTRIEGIIGWFASDVKGMQNLMRQHSVFVGGSLALTLFSPVRFRPSNADLFVSVAGYMPVIHHLTTCELFHVVSVQSVSPAIAVPADAFADETVFAYGAGLLCIATLRRRNTIVHVLCTPNPPPGASTPNLDSLSLSWTTMLFNYVTADYATCAYPAMTLMGRGLFHMERFLSGMPGTSSEHILNAYSERGFEFARHPSWWLPGPDYSCARGWTCPFEVRRFGDGGGLTVPPCEGPVNAIGRSWRFGGVSPSVHDG